MAANLSRPCQTTKLKAPDSPLGAVSNRVAA
ncbi:MAG: hypothetical protein ACJAZN_000571, partial [Planctomycetota bacterium]